VASPEFPPTDLSEIAPGTEIPEKIYLLKNGSGAASITLVDRHGKHHSFQLVFTSLAKAKRFVDLLRQPKGPLKITDILELDSKRYLDRPNAPLVMVDADPRKLLVN
jgi:hypothetical protein